MKPWKWALAVVGLALAVALGKVIGYAIDKRSEEVLNQRDRAWGVSTNNPITEVTPHSRATTEPITASEAINTLDSRLINPPGTVWWSGGGGASFDSYFYIFYGDGRMIRVGGDIKTGVWSISDGLLVKDYIGFRRFTESYLVKSAAGGKWLLFLGNGHGLELCWPKIQNSCSDDPNSNILDELMSNNIKFE